MTEGSAIQRGEAAWEMLWQFSNDSVSHDSPHPKVSPWIECWSFCWINSEAPTLNPTIPSFFQFHHSSFLDTSRVQMHARPSFYRPLSSHASQVLLTKLLTVVMIGDRSAWIWTLWVPVTAGRFGNVPVWHRIDDKCTLLMHSKIWRVRG